MTKTTELIDEITGFVQIFQVVFNMAAGLIALVGALGLGYLSINTEEGSPLTTEVAVREGSTPLAQSDSVSVPSLVGLPLEAARESLSVHGLATGPVLRALASPDDAGKVFKQLPAPGVEVRRGGKVVLHVGAGE